MLYHADVRHLAPAVGILIVLLLSVIIVLMVIGIVRKKRRKNGRLGGIPNSAAYPNPMYYNNQGKSST